VRRPSGVTRRALAVAIAVPTLVGLAVAPAVAGHAVAPKAKHHASFGAKLTRQSQPSNAFGGQPCEPKKANCTRVMTEAYRRPNPEADQVAPKNGTIGKIMLVGGVKGVFRLQIVKANPKTSKAKLVRNGPVIHYLGQNTGQTDNGPPYTIESFPVNVKVEKGDFLAVEAKKISFEYCSGGGDSQITFEPPLVAGAKARHTNHEDGCLMLLEAVYK
jgi:hypothetical protein